jgi:hypothetical protein
VERDEGATVLPAKGLQVQVFEVVKGTDPTTRFRIHGGDARKPINGEMARVVSGRVGRIRKRLLPQFDVELSGVEFDASEEVCSCAVDPGFGDDATGFECRRFVVEVVEDGV